MAAKLMQAGCEIAIKKSKVLSNSISVRAKLQARLQPAWRAGNADRERTSESTSTSGKRVSTAVRRVRLEKSKGRAKRIRKIHGKSSVPWRRRLAQIAHASVSKGKPLTVWRSLGSMGRSCSSPCHRLCRAWRSGCMARARQWCW